MRKMLKTVLCLLAGFPLLGHAVTFLVTPGTVSNLYSGLLTFQVTGLANGETVLVERFLDANANGTIDAGEPLVQSFRLTDGAVTSIGGVRNGNVPGDNDLSANGQISATLSFANGPEFTRAASHYIFRLSSPVSSFSALQQVLSVTNPAYAQHVMGSISSGVTPLPFALVGALLLVGNDNEFVAGASADATGNYSLAVSNATYQMAAFKAGYFASFVAPPAVSVSGADVAANIPMTAGSFTLSGSVVESASGSAIPGVQFFVGSANNEYAVFFSDAQGSFSAALANGQWKLEPSDSSLVLGGYFRTQGKPTVAISGANVSGLNIQCTKETALIYGTVKDDQNHPLAGVSLFAGDSSSLYQSSSLSDASGNFFLAATNGIWYVGTADKNSGLPPNYTLQQVQVTVANGQAVQVNLVARQATAHLFGRATDSLGNPIDNGTMLAFGPNGENVQAQLGGDGSFDLPIHGGSWNISLESQTAATHNVVPPQLSFNVTDGVNISNISYVAPIATRTISGSVKTSQNIGISGLNIFANASINGTFYTSSAQTAADGSYSLPVLPGVWTVGVDSQGLSQRGFGVIFNQNADTSSGNRTVNFIAGTPPVGIIYFRENLGVVGEFGNSFTPAITYPVFFKNYRVFFKVLNDINPPAADTVLFTGPPGSGLTNAPADPGFGVVQDGTNVYYSSPAVHTPATASGGEWSVLYRNNPNNFQQPDPQVFSRLVVPVPTVTVNNDVLQSLRWSYKDQNGNPISGSPSFVLNSRIDVFDQNGNDLFADVVPPATSYTFSAPNLFQWSAIGLVRVAFYDTLGNQYFAQFSESSPTMTGVSRTPGQPFSFLLNAPAGQNYTIQYCTDLGLRNWTTLYVTNLVTSPAVVKDPNTSSNLRFYRVLVGP